MTVLAANTPGESELAVFDSSLQLGESETLGSGVKRVTMEQLELAAGRFFDGDLGFDGAVHESRKSIKRVRALLRLVRGEIPDRIYEFESRSLRDTARWLSKVRSARGVVNAALSIHDLYTDLLADGTFGELMARLERRRDVVELNAVEDPNIVGRVMRSLERAYHRYGSWPTDADAREIYGLGIRDEYDAISPGLTRTYSLGRQTMVTAYRRGGVGDFHVWRRRAKDLRHQMEFLAPLWPEVVVGTAMTLERLGNILGEDNDLAELQELLRRRDDLCPNPQERSLFRALAAQRRSELQLAAELLGRRVYAEEPESLVGRFGEYWNARRMAITGSPDTLVVY